MSDQALLAAQITGMVIMAGFAMITMSVCVFAAIREARSPRHEDSYIALMIFSGVLTGALLSGVAKLAGLKLPWD